MSPYDSLGFWEEERREEGRRVELVSLVPLPSLPMRSFDTKLTLVCYLASCSLPLTSQIRLLSRPVHPPSWSSSSGRLPCPSFDDHLDFNLPFWDWDQDQSDDDDRARVQGGFEGEVSPSRPFSLSSSGKSRWRRGMRRDSRLADFGVAVVSWWFAEPLQTSASLV